MLVGVVVLVVLILVHVQLMSNIPQFGLDRLLFVSVPLHPLLASFNQLIQLLLHFLQVLLHFAISCSG